MPSKPISIWVVTDNKPGHRNQLEGLTTALAKKIPINCTWISVKGLIGTINEIIKLNACETKPELILGAGHRTHPYLLLIKLLTRGKIVVLMKPSLPWNWFDLLLVPQHDNIEENKKIIWTHGVINKIEPSKTLHINKGLFLIGGPSKHHGWNNEKILLQIKSILQADTKISWQLTTSRRTPEEFLKQINSLSESVSIIPHNQTDSLWLPQQLSTSQYVWVTEDSVSMIYEALTAGARTGLIEVPVARPGRLQQGINQLVASKMLTTYRQWLTEKKLNKPSAPLNEAKRCAKLILQFFNYD